MNDFSKFYKFNAGHGTLVFIKQPTRADGTPVGVVLAKSLLYPQVIEILTPPMWLKFASLDGGYLGCDVTSSNHYFVLGFSEMKFSSGKGGVVIFDYPAYGHLTSGSAKVLAPGGLSIGPDILMETTSRSNGWTFGVHFANIDEVKGFREWEGTIEDCSDTLTTKCTKCGMINTYIDPVPNYICSGCKMCYDIWNGRV